MGKANQLTFIRVNNDVSSRFVECSFALKSKDFLSRRDKYSDLRNGINISMLFWEIDLNFFFFTFFY